MTTLRERLLGRLIIDPETGCTLWSGALNNCGYGANVAHLAAVSMAENIRRGHARRRAGVPPMTYKRVDIPPPTPEMRAAALALERLLVPAAPA